MYAWMVNSAVLSQCDLASVRILTSAAAALPVEHARRLRERLPGARLFVMYGQTECKRITYLDPDDVERKAGSVGRGMPYQEHAVVDDVGQPVSAEEIGELVVQGPHVMQGYWRDRVKTEQKLRPIAGRTGAWLHTDDLFRVDAEGYLYFVGRKDDILKVGGHKVSPHEVEEVLCQMPEIFEAAVVGVPDELWGQVARAHVVLREGATYDAAAIVLFCKARLPAFMVPKSVVLEKSLPKTESGKIKKRDLIG
jgi:acyl-coenzyme A synthetase/AMP-(fatty) acid ligase